MLPEAPWSPEVKIGSTNTSHTTKEEAMMDTELTAQASFPCAGSSPDLDYQHLPCTPLLPTLEKINFKPVMPWTATPDILSCSLDGLMEQEVNMWRCKKLTLTPEPSSVTSPIHIMAVTLASTPSNTTESADPFI